MQFYWNNSLVHPIAHDEVVWSYCTGHKSIPFFVEFFTQFLQHRRVKRYNPHWVSVDVNVLIQSVVIIVGWALPVLGRNDSRSLIDFFVLVEDFIRAFSMGDISFKWEFPWDKSTFLFFFKLFILFIFFLILFLFEKTIAKRLIFSHIPWLPFLQLLFTLIQHVFRDVFILIWFKFNPLLILFSLGWLWWLSSTDSVGNRSLSFLEEFQFGLVDIVVSLVFF